MLHTHVKGGQIHIQKRREEKECGLHLLLNESFCREQNRVAATPFLCYAATLIEFVARGRMTRRELKLLVKLDELVVESEKSRRMESERARPSPARAVFENFLAVGAGSASTLPRRCLLQP